MKDLSRVLFSLSHDIVNIVRSAKVAGKIQKVATLWIRNKVSDFKYHEGGGLTFSCSHEFFVKEEWNWISITQVIKPEIEKLPSYADAYRHILDIYGINEAQAKFYVDRFVDRIINEVLNENAKEEALVEIITTFINDLEGNPLIWNAVIEVEGLLLKDEEVELAKGIKVRRPMPSDLEFEEPFGSLISLFSPLFNVPSAIIEATLRMKNLSDVLDELEKLIAALRLYKLGSIIRGRVMLRPRSVIQSQMRIGGFVEISPIIYRYSLSSEDSHKIQAFLNKIKPLLPVSRGRIQIVDHVSIALQRYNDALFKSDFVERLTYAVMGLEALFLNQQEREELARRLAQRVAKCLSVFGYSPLEVYEIIKKSYDIRSTFVHGALIKEEKQTPVSKLADKVMEYLRISLLMFLELEGKVKKEHLIKIIDNSLLSQEYQTKLENLIKGNCEITLMLVK